MVSGELHHREGEQEGAREGWWWDCGGGAAAAAAAMDSGNSGSLQSSSGGDDEFDSRGGGGGGGVDSSPLSALLRPSPSPSAAAFSLHGSYFGLQEFMSAASASASGLSLSSSLRIAHNDASVGAGARTHTTTKMICSNAPVFLGADLNLARCYK